MADVEIARTFRTLSEQLQNVSNVLSHQAIAQTIPCYDGNPKEFNAWIKAIEKYRILNELEANKLIIVAYQSSKETVSNFIRRFMVDNPDKSWQMLKQELQAKFAEVQDYRIAFKLLSSLKQKQDETVQIFAERLFMLAEDAKINQPQGNTVTELQLIEYFIDGLSQDSVRFKIMEREPVTFQAAVDIAVRHQTLQARFNLRKSESRVEYELLPGQEPMDISHLRPKSCSYCKRTGHTIEECRRRTKNVNAYTGARQSNSGPRQNVDVNWRDKIECWNCGKMGHFSRECTSPRSNSRSGVNQYQGQNAWQYANDGQNQFKKQEN